MSKLRVKIPEHRHFYIHNDIANAAFYFKTKIEEKLARNEREGIGLDMMACLTMLAFEIEAKFNFLGYKLIEQWDERSAAIKKVEVVTRHLGVEADMRSRPSAIPSFFIRTRRSEPRLCFG
jgi:hypothetical protein